MKAIEWARVDVGYFRKDESKTMLRENAESAFRNYEQALKEQQMEAVALVRDMRDYIRDYAEEACEEKRELIERAEAYEKDAGK